MGEIYEVLEEYLDNLVQKTFRRFAVIILIFAAGVIAYQQATITYVVSDDSAIPVISYTDDTKLIIGRSGVKLTDHSNIILDYFNADSKENVIFVTNPYKVTVYDKGKKVKSVVVAGTVEDALRKAGVKLKEGDKVTPGKNVPITEDIKIEVLRAFTVTLICDGRTQKIKTTACTVEEFLNTAGIRLGDEDIVTVKLNKKLTKSTKVQVKRVTYKQTKKSESVPFTTEVEYDDSMYEEQCKVKRNGKNGKQTNYYKNKYIDGKYVSKELVKTEVTKEPVSKIVVWGSRPSLYGGNVARRVISELTPPYRIDMDENNRPIKYKKKIVGKATAYCTGTVTSTGRKAQPGVVAVDPREIPYGSKLYIVSSDNRYVYGYAIAGDTGGFIHNSSTVVDLYIRGYEACKQFGRRTVEIYVLE